MKIIAALIVLSTLVSCHDGCLVNETRCSGDKVEICMSDEDWVLVTNCAETQEICCEDNLIVAGEPVAACAEVCK